MEITQNMIAFIEIGVCIVTLLSIIIFSRWPAPRDGK
jgi:hypothetical protein